MTIWESQYSAIWFSLWNVTPRGELSVSHDASPQVTNGYIICPIKSPHPTIRELFFKGDQKWFSPLAEPFD